MNRLQLRLISLVITIIAIGLSQAGFGDVREIRIYLIGGTLIVVGALWLAPYAEKFWAKRNNDRDEALRMIEQGRVRAAEELLDTAWQTVSKRRTSTVAAKLEVLLPLADARRLNNKLDLAMETLQVAGDLAPNEGKVFELRARVQADRSNFKSAAEAWQAAIRIEEAKVPRPASVANLYCEMGLALRQAGKDAESNKSLQAALEITENTVGPKHADTGRILGLLGAGYQQEGRTSDALACLQRAVSIQETGPRADSAEAADALFHLGLAYQEEGNKESAVAAYERVLLLRERQVGGDTGELALAQYNLANVLIEWGRYGRAEELLRRAASLLQNTPDQRYASVITSLGYMYEMAGRMPEAEPKYREAMEIWQKIAGLNSVESVQAHQRLAALLHMLKRPEESAAVMERIPRSLNQQAATA